MFRKCCSVKVLAVILVASLILFAGALVLTFVGIPLIITSQIEGQTELAQGTDQWDRFVELPFPIDLKVNIWNVDNPDDIIKGENPIMSEKGPYIYKENKKKNILDLNNAEDTVTYENEVVIEFDAENSIGQEDDTVTILNPIFQTIIHETSSIERLVLAGCMDQLLPSRQYPLNDLFVEVKVRDLLFDGLNYGYEEDVGVACGIVRKMMLERARNVKPVDFIYKEGATGTDNKDVHYMKFSMFSFKTVNGTNKEGNFTVYRGRKDSSLLGETLRWKGSTEIQDMWGTSTSINNDTCKVLRGTDTTIFHSNIKKHETLKTFTADICRGVDINYIGEDVYNNIKGYRFEARDSLWSTTENPENDCFCTKSSKDEFGNPSCFLDGVFDYSPCIGAPMIISFPHFLDAHPKYSGNITGLTPNEDAHRIYLLVEPNTGTPLQGHKRVQINSVLRPVGSIPVTQHVPRLLLPVVWIDEGVNLPQKYVDFLNDEYFNKVTLATGLKYGFIALTAAMVVLSSIFLIRKYCSNKRNH